MPVAQFGSQTGCLGTSLGHTVRRKELTECGAVPFRAHTQRQKPFDKNRLGPWGLVPSGLGPRGLGPCCLGPRGLGPKGPRVQGAWPFGPGPRARFRVRTFRLVGLTPPGPGGWLGYASCLWAWLWVWAWPLGPVLTLLAVVFSAYCVLGLDLLEQLGWSSLESSQRVSFGSGKSG